MNTETQFLVKIFPIKNCLINMLNCDELVEAKPTILWMTQEVNVIMRIVTSRAKDRKQATSWARQADVVLNNVYDLQQTIKDEVAILDKPNDSPFVQKHPGLWYAVVCSELLGDMHRTKLGQKILGDMVESSFTVEDIAVESNKKIKGGDHNQIFDEARVFVERIYKAMG